MIYRSIRLMNFSLCKNPNLWVNFSFCVKFNFCRNPNF